MVSPEEILEAPLTVLCHCSLLPERVHDLLWGWNVRNLGKFVAAVHERQYRLPHLHSEGAQAELRAARECVLNAVRLAVLLDGGRE